MGYKSFTAISVLSDPPSRSCLCSLFIAAALICSVYFIGSSFVAKENKENQQCRLPGTEALPEGIVSKTSNLEMRPLWSSPSKLNNQRPPMNLLAIAAGIKQKKIVDQIVRKFPSKDFVVMLFHYDGVVDEWKDLVWADRAIHVSAANQTKWWFAKRFLHPDIVAEYNYIFLWDEDIGVENFNPRRYLSIVKDEGLEISQPALDPVKSEVHHPITARRRNSKAHRRMYKYKGSGRCDDYSTAPPCIGWVEMMAPVFSRAAWRCAWYMIQLNTVGQASDDLEQIANPVALAPSQSRRYDNRPEHISRNNLYGQGFKPFLFYSKSKSLGFKAHFTKMPLLRLLLRSSNRHHHRLSFSLLHQFHNLALNPNSPNPNLNPIAARGYAFSSAEEAAAERRRRKRRLRIEPPLHAIRPNPTQPPPRDPNAPRLPDTTSALVGPRLNLHNRVQSLIRAGDLDAASYLARQAVFSRIRPTVFTCNAIIAAMYRAKRYDDAVALFKYFFDQADIVPNIVSYNNLINTYCDEGKVDEGMNVFRRIIETAPVGPSSNTYRHLTKGFVDAGRIGEAVDLLRDMLSRQLGADSLVYNNLISGFLNLGNLEKANELFDELKQRCLVYDGVVNATFMEWWFNQGKDKEAMQSYKSLMERNFRMTPATCNTLLEVLLKHEKKEEAQALFEQMLDNHQPPNIQAVNSDTFNIMVNECFKHGKFSEAVETFKKAGTHPKSKPFAMDVAGYNNIIARYCENEMLEEAEKLLREISTKSLSPDVTTFRTLIDAYLKVERIDDALELFNRMVESGLRVVVSFGTKVFNELITKGKVAECAPILTKMGEKDPKPDFLIYDVVVRGLCNEGLFDMSKDIVDQMIKYGVGITPALQDFVRETFGKAGRGEEIERVLNADRWGYAAPVPPPRTSGPPQMTGQQYSGYNRMAREQQFGSNQMAGQQSLGPNQMEGPQHFGSYQRMGQQSFGPNQMAGQQHFTSNQMMGQQSFRPTQMSGYQQFGSNQMMGQQSFGPNKMAGEQPFSPFQRMGQQSSGPSQMSGQQSSGPSQMLGQQSLGPNQMERQQPQGSYQKWGQQAFGSNQMGGQQPSGYNRMGEQQHFGWQQMSGHQPNKIAQWTGQPPSAPSQTAGQQQSWQPQTSAQQQSWSQAAEQPPVGSPQEDQNPSGPPEWQENHQRAAA
ncbi:pentatricopeptide repeat-containing protein [Citrus sinensis]|nr:pentatricopeptide repeat-containing protein [Citrus sinensis]